MGVTFAVGFSVGVGGAVGSGVAVVSDVTLGLDSVGADVPGAAVGKSVDIAAGNVAGR
jgi:hypothetical protein